jgi:hypothetical protein
MKAVKTNAHIPFQATAFFCFCFDASFSLSAERIVLRAVLLLLLLLLRFKS